MSRMTTTLTKPEAKTIAVAVAEQPKAVVEDNDVEVTPEMVAFYLAGEDDETDMKERGGSYAD